MASPQGGILSTLLGSVTQASYSGLSDPDEIFSNRNTCDAEVAISVRLDEDDAAAKGPLP